jgi:hypothetical protein
MSVRTALPWITPSLPSATARTIGGVGKQQNTL